MMLEEPELFHKIHEYKVHNDSTVRGTDQCREKINRLGCLACPLLCKLITLLTFKTEQLIFTNITIQLTDKEDLFDFDGDIRLLFSVISSSVIISSSSIRIIGRILSDIIIGGVCGVSC